MPISNYIEKQIMTIYVDTIWENLFIYLKLHLPRPLQALYTDTQITKAWKMRLELSALRYGQRQWQLKNGIHKGYLNPSNSNIYIQDSSDWSLYTRFKPFFEQKIQLFSRTHFPFFKYCIQCKKEPWVCLFWFFHNMSNFILKVFLCLLLLGTWESGPSCSKAD